MEWLQANAAAVQAVAAVVSLGVTAILAWLTAQYVRLTRQLADGSAKQAELLAKQTDHLRLAELEFHKRHAAALRGLCRRIRVTTRHLDPKRPNAAATKGFTYVRDSDVAVFSAQALDVSVEVASSADLVAAALQKVIEQVAFAQASDSWQPTPQQIIDWEGALKLLGTDIPEIEDACDAVLRSTTNATHSSVPGNVQQAARS